MHRKSIDDPAFANHLGTIAPDGVTTFTLSPDAGPPQVRGALIHGTRAIAQMQANHGLGPLETLLLGRAYLCAGLMACGLKDLGAISFRIDGDGPAEGLAVEGRREGSGLVAVRGYLFRSPIELEAPPESLESGSYFGRGALTVTRFLEKAPHPVSGAVALRGGAMAKEIAAYYLESEQTRTALDAGVQFDRAGRPSGAGALLLQALPGADDDFLAEVEASVPGLPPLGLWFSQGGTRDGLVSGMFGRFNAQRTAEAGFGFLCPCSRARFESYLESLDARSLADLAGRGPWPIETVCHHCGSKYHYERAEILGLMERRGIRLPESG